MRQPSASVRRVAARGLVGVGLLLAIVSPGLAQAQDETADPRSFSDTGYAITDDAIWTFFSQYGGAATFGAPVSREFTLLGAPVQLFQDAALQVQPDGSVRPMQLTDPGLVPYLHLNGLSVPDTDPVIAFVAPSPDQANYPARVQAFVQATVPDTWTGLPVGFLTTYTAQGGAAVWGLPTSAPAADPTNPHFVYQRFQNGILLYDAAAGTTSALPLGEYLKDILTGQNIPADLASEAAASPLLRAAGLKDTNIADAFVADVS